MTAKKQLPNFNEFARGSIGELGPLLAVVRNHEGDRASLKREIAKLGTLPKTKDAKQRSVRSGNVLIGMSTCELFDSDENRLTPIGRALAEETDASRRAERFAKHLLHKRYGLEVLETAREVRARDGRVTKDALNDALRERGFFVTTNSGDAGKLRAWLEPAGVVTASWEINDQVLSRLSGAVLGSVTDFRRLTNAQRGLLEVVRDLSASTPGAWVEGTHVKRLCAERFGPTLLPEDSLRRKVIDPLVTGKWLETRGTGQGRGGKLGEMRTTARVAEVPVEIPLGGGLPQEVLDKLATPLPEIMEDLASDDTHVKGVALEALAVRLVRDLGLRPSELRERSDKTGGAEVDLVADGVGLTYSRWLVQCKNTPGGKVGVSALAKEIGMAVLLKAHVVVVVTTGAFARSVQQHADLLAETTAMQAVLVDGEVLSAWSKRGGLALVEYFAERAGRTLRSKLAQLSDAHQDAGP
jgi:hypothetical protein